LNPFVFALCLALPLFGQTLVGLPEYGVTLSGAVQDPVIENHSGRVIIGYNIDQAYANGRVMSGVGQILAPSVLPAGLPDGKSLYAMGTFPVDPNLQRGGRAVNVGARSAVKEPPPKRCSRSGQTGASCALISSSFALIQVILVARHCTRQFSVHLPWATLRQGS